MARHPLSVLEFIRISSVRLAHFTYLQGDSRLRHLNQKLSINAMKIKP